MRCCSVSVSRKVRQHSGLRNREVSTLIRFTAPGDYLPIVRNRDVAELLPAEELKKRFPDCAAG